MFNDKFVPTEIKIQLTKRLISIGTGQRTGIRGATGRPTDFRLLPSGTATGQSTGGAQIRRA